MIRFTKRTHRPRVNAKPPRLDLESLSLNRDRDGSQNKQLFLFWLADQQLSDLAHEVHLRSNEPNNKIAR